MKTQLLFVFASAVLFFSSGAMQAANPSETDGIPTMAVSEVNRDLHSLSGKIIRLKFILRDEIEPADGGFSTVLYDQELESLPVFFAVEGRDSVRKIPLIASNMRRPPLRGQIKGAQYAFVRIESRSRLNVKGSVSGGVSDVSARVVGRNAPDAW